jgi:hypothetical protein
MMRSKLTGLIVILSIIVVGCSKTEPDPGPPPPLSKITKLKIRFTQNVNGVDLDPTDTIQYTNLSENIYSVQYMRYLISNIRLNDYNYSNYEIEEEHLVDVKDENTLLFEVQKDFPTGHYASISLFVGFLEEENVTGKYPDLSNLTPSWNYPLIYGGVGGYYTLQLGGRFYTNSADLVPDPYDLGLGGNTLVVTSTDSTWQPNEIIASLKDSGFEIPDGTESVTVEIKVDLNLLFESQWGLANLNLVAHNAELEADAVGSAALSGNLSTAFKMGSVTFDE